MFTGIIRKTARIALISKHDAGALLKVENPWAAPLEAGESVAVSGACLTVISANQREISFDLSAETLESTIFSSAAPGESVNLEPALKVGDDISGHFVTGHVDGTGRVVSLVREREFARLAVEAPEALLAYLVPRGSVAVNGVSLTIARLDGSTFEIAVIPETLRRTNLGSLRPGDSVNLEGDLLGKYVIRYLHLAGFGGEGPGKLSLDRLEEMGY